jgi:small subunit ribosomal protein S10e
MVLISREQRRAVYTQLFEDGVMVVEKDFAKKFHQDVKSCPNLQVLMLLKSLASRNFVTCKFNWGWNYYILNDAGIEHLREALGLPVTALPLTMTKQTKTEAKERPERTSQWRSQE